MKNDIDFLLISSNNRKLYQEDVFNAISFPKNYIIQYRYNLKYLEKDLYDAIYNHGHTYQKTLDTYFKEKNCVLAYLHKENNSSNVYLFRQGLIKQVIYNADISRLLFFIELKEYVKLEDTNLTVKLKNHIISSFNSKDTTCVFDLISKKAIHSDIKVVKFFETANVFSKLIPARLFFSINLKQKYTNYSNGKHDRLIKPVIDPSTNLSKYVLEDGSNYFFEILTYEVDKFLSKKDLNTKVEFNVTTTSEYINFNQHVLNNGSYNINFLDLIIKPISAETVSTSIKFTESETNFITNILIDIKKSKIRSVLFSLSTFMVLVTVPLSNFFIDIRPDKKDLLHSPFLIFVITFIIFVISALRFLYRYFDKK